jgi:hypothetical protein
MGSLTSEPSILCPVLSNRAEFEGSTSMPSALRSSIAEKIKSSFKSCEMFLDKIRCYKTWVTSRYEDRDTVMIAHILHTESRLLCIIISIRPDLVPLST